MPSIYLTNFSSAQKHPKISLGIYSKILFLNLLVIMMGCTMIHKSTTTGKPEMVFMEGGSFIMGDVVDTLHSDALPLHPVTLGDYYIGKYEVTYEEYDAFARKSGFNLPDDDFYGRGKRAVNRVSWDEALAFCESFGWRLPTENEWEYAARSGGKIEAYSGTNHADSLHAYAVFGSRSLAFTQRVGERKPNEAGLYDMSGNAFEWIGRYYQFYEQPENWHDLENSSMRIIRGGSFKMHATAVQNFWRVGVLGNIRDYDIGFRCAVSQKELNKQRFLGGFFHRKPKRP